MTISIAIFAFWQVLIYRQMRDHNKVIERAYVRMSHRPQGLFLDEDGRFKVRFEIKNCGRTPGAVNHGYWRLIPGLQQTQPDPFTLRPGQTDEGFPGGFLTSGDRYFVEVPLNMTDVAWLTMHKGNIWLVAHIVYVDAFGDRHWGGYARYVQPDAPNGSNNLVWDHASAAYNFDQEIDAQGQPKKKRKHWP